MTSKEIAVVAKEISHLAENSAGTSGNLNLDLYAEAKEKIQCDSKGRIKTKKTVLETKLIAEEAWKQEQGNSKNHKEILDEFGATDQDIEAIWTFESTSYVTS